MAFPSTVSTSFFDSASTFCSTCTNVSSSFGSTFHFQIWLKLASVPINFGGNLTCRWAERQSHNITLFPWGNQDKTKRFSSIRVGVLQMMFAEHLTWLTKVVRSNRDTTLPRGNLAWFPQKTEIPSLSVLNLKSSICNLQFIREHKTCRKFNQMLESMFEKFAEIFNSMQLWNWWYRITEFAKES